MNYYSFMNYLESLEDYLERILMLQERNGVVRSIDIATDMGFSKPSVSIAMKKLKEKAYIEIDDKGHISLTKAGYIIARKTLDKHEMLISLLTKIGVDEEVAREDACKIEHSLSDVTVNKLKELVEKL